MRKIRHHITYHGFLRTWIQEYWIPILIALAVIGLIAAVVYSELTREYYSAPVEACQRTRTGRTETQVHMQCVANGNNPCGSQIPIMTVYHEYEYTCAWRKME